MADSEKRELTEIAARIKLMVFDVDGVMTDGRIIYNDDGVEEKNFNVRDGHGMKLLMDGGVGCAIITARSSKVVEIRARNLGIEKVFQGVSNKVDAFEKILIDEGLTALDVGYMGDDLVDLPVLRRVGFSAAPADAVAEVVERVDYVSPLPGGAGAVRDVCEEILKAKGLWTSLMERYLN